LQPIGFIDLHRTHSNYLYTCKGEKRDVFDLADFARAAPQADVNLERAQVEAAAWKEILGSVVKAKREGDFSKGLNDKDVKAAIEAAQNTVSR
jgi:hypothetical protein